MWSLKIMCATDGYKRQTCSPKQKIQNQIYKNMISEACSSTTRAAIDYMSHMLMKQVDQPIRRLLPGHTGICSCEYSSCPSFSSR